MRLKRLSPVSKRGLITGCGPIAINKSQFFRYYWAFFALDSRIRIAARGQDSRNRWAVRSDVLCIYVSSRFHSIIFYCYCQRRQRIHALSRTFTLCYVEKTSNCGGEGGKIFDFNPARFFRNIRSLKRTCVRAAVGPDSARSAAANTPGRPITRARPEFWIF